MKGAAEAWSLPWHELQRHLAKSAAPTPVKQLSSSASPFSRRGPAISPAVSWMARGRAAAAAPTSPQGGAK